jgi:hypothetical protein
MGASRQCQSLLADLGGRNFAWPPADCQDTYVSRGLPVRSSFHIFRMRNVLNITLASLGIVPSELLGVAAVLAGYAAVKRHTMVTVSRIGVGAHRG